jgi:hypothetical protein
MRTDVVSAAGRFATALSESPHGHRQLRLIHLSENRLVYQQTPDWKTACFSVVVPGGEGTMQATRALRREPHMDVNVREDGSREMEDVLSRYLPRFYRASIDNWATQPTQRMLFRMHSWPLTNIWINSKVRLKCRHG